MRTKIFAIALLLLFTSLNLNAKPFLVTNTHDSGMGSFRQAIIQANINPGADTIQFSVSDTIRLTLSAVDLVLILPSIEDSLIIYGNNSCLLSEASGRFMRINEYCEVRNLTFKRSSTVSTGGGVWATANAGYVKFDSCNFVDNQADGWGGGLSLDCSADLTSCSFNANHSTDGGGLAIRFISIVTIENCAFTDNTTSGDGGAIWIWGPVELIIKSGSFVSSAGEFDQNIHISDSSPDYPSGNVVLAPGFEVNIPRMLLITTD